MLLKQEEIKKAAQPVRQVVQLDRVVNSYKPVANHKVNVSYQSTSQMSVGEAFILRMCFGFTD